MSQLSSPDNQERDVIPITEGDVQLQVAFGATNAKNILAIYDERKPRCVFLILICAGHVPEDNREIFGIEVQRMSRAQTVRLVERPAGSSLHDLDRQTLCCFFSVMRGA